MPQRQAKAAKTLAAVAASTFPQPARAEASLGAEAPTAKAGHKMSEAKARAMVLELIKTVGPSSSACKEVFGTSDAPVSDHHRCTRICHSLANPK